MTTLAYLAAHYLAFDPTLNGPTQTLKTALGNLFAIALAVGAVWLLLIAKKVGKAVGFLVLAAICALFFDVGAIQSLGGGLKSLLGL